MNRGRLPVPHDERRNAIFFFLHSGQSPPEWPDPLPEPAEPPQAHFRCKVAKGAGVKRGGAAAVGFLGICSLISIKSIYSLVVQSLQGKGVTCSNREAESG